MAPCANQEGAHVNSTKIKIIITAGFSLQLLLVTFSVWPGAIHGAISEELNYSLAEVRSLVFALTFFIGSVLSIGKSRLDAGICSIIALVIFLMGVLIQNMHQNAVSAVCSSALLAVSTSIFFLIWELVFSKCNFEFAGISMGIAMSISAILYIMLSPFKNYTPFFMPALAIAIAMLQLLAFNTYGSPNVSHLNMQSNYRVFFRVAWPSIICAASIYLVSGAARNSMATDFQFFELSDIASMSAMILAGIVFALCWNLSSPRTDIPRFYQIAFPIVATSYFVLPFLPQELFGAFSGFIFLFVSTIASLVMLTSIQISNEVNAPVTFSYGICGGLCYLCVAIGDFIGRLVHHDGGYGIVQMLIVSFVCLYILAMALFAIRRRQAEPSKSNKDPIDCLSQSCTLIAQEKHLTQREEEIMIMMARGRDLPTISSTLFISKSTVQYHSKNLYKKLGVHSKQELIDTIEHYIDNSSAQ